MSILMGCDDWVFTGFINPFIGNSWMKSYGRCGFHMGFANFGDQDPRMVFFLRKWSQKASNTDVFCTWGLENPNDTIFCEENPKKKYQALLFMRRTYMVISPSQLGINRYCGLLFLGDPIQDYRLCAINPQINIGYRLSITTLFGLTSIVSYNALLLDCYSRNLWVDNILGDILLAKG